MSKFEIGDEVVFVDAATEHKYLIGEECEILKLLDRSHSTCETPQLYEISLRHNGLLVGCAECCLRKKKPPEATWEEIQALTNWNPSKEVISE